MTVILIPFSQNWHAITPLYNPHVLLVWGGGDWFSDLESEIANEESVW